LFPQQHIGWVLTPPANFPPPVADPPFFPDFPPATVVFPPDDLPIVVFPDFPDFPDFPVDLPPFFAGEGEVDAGDRLLEESQGEN